MKIERDRYSIGDYYYDNYKRIQFNDFLNSSVSLRCDDTNELIVAKYRKVIDEIFTYSEIYNVVEREKLDITSIEDIYDLEHQNEYYKGNYWLHSSNNYLTVDKVEELNKVNYIFTKNTNEEEFEIIFYKLLDKNGTVKDVVRKKYKLKEKNTISNNDIWTLVYSY